MTVREALIDGGTQLKNMDTPHLDAALLLAHSCGTNREQLYMQLLDPLDMERIIVYRKALKRRIAGEPVAWITGTKEFWGLEFQVGPGVLCPRPDSEILVETALDSIPEDIPFRLHDCCSGPGTLAVAIASERPLLQASASDVSDDAAHYFNLNNTAHTGGRISFIKNNLLDGIDGPFDMIISNPPYLTPAETLERIEQGWREPALALNGDGVDGLSIITKLIGQASIRLANGGILMLEAAPLQIPAIGNMLSASGFHSLVVVKDLGGHNRVIHARVGVAE